MFAFWRDLDLVQAHDKIMHVAAYQLNY